MRFIGNSARHVINSTPESATYEQCQRIWGLMQMCRMEPQWCDDLPYHQAIKLIRTLEQLHHSRKVMRQV